jgi:hypothetical protein
MRVARAFREAGFDVSQFEHYIDQESQDVRPIDIVASLSKNIENSRVTIKFFIECKYTRSKPWVILITSERFNKYAFYSRILRGSHPSNWEKVDSVQGRLVARILLAVEKENLNLDPFLIEKGAYIVRESLIDDPDPKRKDVAYEATVQVSKSVEAHDIESEKIFKGAVETFEDYRDPDARIVPEFKLFLNIAFPVVVINGELFESCLGKDNQLQVAQIKNGIVLVPYRRKETDPHAQVTLSPVTIVTEQALENYVKLVHEASENLLSQVKAIQDLIEHERSKITRPSQKEIEF